MGPVLLVPMAGVIKVFGNEPWAPGLVAAIEITGLLAAIAWLQLRRASAVIVSGYMLSFGLVSYALIDPNFWSAGLGEMPAALLCVLAGTVVAAGVRPRTAHVAIASLLLGAAVMTKHLSFLTYVPLAVWLGFNVVAELPTRAAALRMALTSVAWLLVPPLAFEVWKFLSLGLDAFVANWGDFIQYSLQQAGATQTSSPLERVVRHVGVFRGYFGMSVWLVLAVDVCVAGLVWWRAQDRRAVALSLFFASAAMVHLLWWLFFSLGWPRYALIGLVLHAAALSTLVYVRPAALAAMLVIVVAAVHSPGLDRLQAAKHALGRGGREPERIAHLRQAVAFLTHMGDSRPFVSSWWATVADLEYALPSPDNFRHYNVLTPADAERALILVRNTQWTNFKIIPEFQAWEAACAEVLFHKPPYLVSRCPSQREQLSAFQRMAASAGQAAGPQPQITIVAGTVRLVVSTPSKLRLDVAGHGQKTLEIVFGIDDANSPAGALRSTCFAIKGFASDRDARELLNRCPAWRKEPNRRSEERRTLVMPADVARLELETYAPDGSPPVRAYWSDLKIIL